MRMGAGGERGPEVKSRQRREDRFWQRYEAVGLAEDVEAGSPGLARAYLKSCWANQ